MSRATRAPGLLVRKHPTPAAPGYVITHEPSGRDLGLWLRLQRHAEQAAAEPGATGIDFTLPAAELRFPKWGDGPFGPVMQKWRQRQRACCEDGEHYNPHTYAMNGRCHGPLSNGHPRKS